MQHDFGIAARLEDRALAHELVAQLVRVDQVAVVADRDLAVRAVDEESAERSTAGSRLPSSTARGRSRACPGRLGERVAVEDVGHVAHRPGDADLLAVGRGDAGALLAAMLQRVQTEVGHVGGFGMTEDAEDAAFVLELVHGQFVTRRDSGDPPARTCRSIVTSTTPARASVDRRPRIARRRPGLPTAIRSRFPPVSPMTRAGTPAAAARCKHFRHIVGGSDTTTRDADSPNSAAASLIRRVSCDVDLERDLGADAAVPKQHSASVTASPPSEQSCAERTSARRPASRADPEGALAPRDPERGGAPRTRPWTTSDTRCRPARPRLRPSSTMTSPDPWKRPRQAARSACSSRPTTPMTGVG